MPLIVSGHLAWMRQQGLAASTADKRRLVLARVARFCGVPVCEVSAPQLAGWRASLTMGNAAVAADLSHVREVLPVAGRRGAAGR